MESCAYVRENGITCRSSYKTKEVEFRHPDYREFSQNIFLCEVHFEIVFLPIIDEERIAFRIMEREGKSYQEMYHKARKSITEGSGYFDREDFKNSFYGKAAKARQELYVIKNGRCRLEYCKQSLKGIRKPYLIRIHPITPLEYTNLFFCSKKHWEGIKFRIGLLTKKESNPSSTLESYLDSN